jgi:hypothetical protein
MKKEMMKRTQEWLHNKLHNTIEIMMDERCMLSHMILGLAKKSVARTSHECRHSSEDWGGGPVMDFFWDDYQLLAIGYSGATNIPQLHNNKSSKGMNGMTQFQ